MRNYNEVKNVKEKKFITKQQDFRLFTLKVSTDKKVILAQMIISILDRVEDSVGNGENACLILRPKPQMCYKKFGTT